MEKCVVNFEGLTSGIGDCFANCEIETIKVVDFCRRLGGRIDTIESHDLIVDIDTIWQDSCKIQESIDEEERDARNKPYSVESEEKLDELYSKLIKNDDAIVAKMMELLKLV